MNKQQATQTDFQADLRAVLSDDEVQQALEKFRTSRPGQDFRTMVEVFSATAIINKKGMVSGIEVNRWLTQSDGTGQFNTEHLYVDFVRSGKSIVVAGYDEDGDPIEGKFNIPPAAFLDILTSLDIDSRRPAGIFKRLKHESENFDFY